MRAAPFLFLALNLGAIAQTQAPLAEDPYADEPYWYQPGHPLEPARATALQTRPGFAAERILTVPRELGSWTALTVDPQGRLLAVAQHQPGIYRITPPPLDRADAPTKLEKLGGAAADIGWAHGLLAAFDSLYVTVAEEGSVETGVYRLRDTNQDGVLDHTERLFGLPGTGEHGPHQIVVTPDGQRLAMIIGNGTVLPEDLAARRPTETEGIDHLTPPGFEPSRHSAQGWVLQFAPDGSDREVFCTGLRNAYDLAFNPRGDLFTYDSDDEWDLGTPWYRPTRIVQLVSGGEYGWRNGGAAWPEHYEDSVPPVLELGPGSPTGLAFGHGSAFPGRYQHALYVGDWTFGAVHAVFLEPDGAGYQAETEEFLGGNGLPVTDLVFAPDGAMYVAVGGRRLGSAIYRVRATTDTVAAVDDRPTAAPRLRALRRELEALHGRPDPAAIDAAWPHLGHPDRLIRFAARVAVENQPVAHWRKRVGTTEPGLARQTALLALARQGEAADLEAILRAVAGEPLGERSTADQLRILRVAELALARSGESAIGPAEGLLTVLRGIPAGADARVIREAARLRARLGDETLIPQALQWMEADAGSRPSWATHYITRNPKYGQALQDMLVAAPRLERMHHAQMLLWLVEALTPAQRQRYFALVGDAMRHSRGGHLYVQFWERIRDAALERVPEGERETLLARATPPENEHDELPLPEGPGREWTVSEVLRLAAAGLGDRDFDRGRRMFAAASCRTCHRLAGEGGVMGPALAGLGDRFTLQDVVEAIVEPNRAVSDQYRMVVLELNDGSSVAGRLLSRDAEATHLAPDLLRPGETVAVANARIVQERQLDTSTMPPGLLNTLNGEEVLDLLAYLVSGGDPAHRVFTPQATAPAGAP